MAFLYLWTVYYKMSGNKDIAILISDEIPMLARIQVYIYYPIIVPIIRGNILVDTVTIYVERLRYYRIV